MLIVLRVVVGLPRLALVGLRLRARLRFTRGRFKGGGEVGGEEWNFDGFFLGGGG